MTHSAKNKFWEPASSFVMVSLQEDYEIENQNESSTKNSLSMETESLHLPLDCSICMIFTGYYNGIGVEIRSLEEMSLLHQMGCFGKGSASRSKPKVLKNNSPTIMRKRQFLKRNYWYNRFAKSEKSAVSDNFFKEIDNLTKKIVKDTKNQGGRDVIDLVSSDENESEENDQLSDISELDLTEEKNIVVIVPNSDSEDDNYFANMKPQCCINKIILQEKLMLTLEEAFFLLYGLGCLQIVDKNDQLLSIDGCWKSFSDSSCKFVEKYVVYHYFRSKGYIVKPGIKFGGDYLLYREGPGISHADYIVVINYGDDNFDWISMLGHVRMATTTVKEVMIAEVIKPKDNIKLPQNLCEYKVRELVVRRKLPVIIDGGED